MTKPTSIIPVFKKLLDDYEAAVKKSDVGAIEKTRCLLDLKVEQLDDDIYFYWERAEGSELY